MIGVQGKLCKESIDANEYHKNFSEERLHELYPKLRRYCLFLSQNSWDGEDLVQDALMKAWLHYNNKSEVSTSLLTKIAHNEWIDKVRKRSKETLESIPERGDEGVTQIDDRFDLIQRLINTLTPKQAVVFALKEGFQYQIGEIAELLQTTETSVKAAIYRAKKRMENEEQTENHQLIKHYWENEERQQIEQILHRAFKNQDPSILIKSIPFIRCLRKDTIATCTIQKSRMSQLSSSTFLMAA